MLVITGGAGFIGSAVLWQLNALGARDIVIVDNLGKSAKWRNLVGKAYADYMHRDHFIQLVRENRLPWSVEAIVHLGACSSTTELDADFLMENNFHYSRDLCRFALDHGARFINASSAATYGNGENGFDDAAPLSSLRPLNMYGYSKHLVDLWLEKEGLLGDVASLKFFNVYGPNEYHKGTMRSVAVKLFEEITQRGTATLFASCTPEYSDGEQKRDFVYVKDCARIVAWLLENGEVNGILNVGSGVARTFNDLANAVGNALDRRIEIHYTPMPESLAAAYQNYTCASMAWPDRYAYPGRLHTLEEGITDYVQNYLDRSCAHL